MFSWLNTFYHHNSQAYQLWNNPLQFNLDPVLLSCFTFCFYTAMTNARGCYFQLRGIWSDFLVTVYFGLEYEVWYNESYRNPIKAYFSKQTGSSSACSRLPHAITKSTVKKGFFLSFIWQKQRKVSPLAHSNIRSWFVFYWFIMPTALGL